MMRLSELVGVLNGHPLKARPLKAQPLKAQHTDAKLIGADTTFLSVGTDSRHIKAGQLFVAIKGEHFDGNQYAAAAMQQGAAAALISDAENTISRQLTSAVLVKDTRLALGKLASDWRNQFTGPLIAITGSNGKTTVKEMTASILAVATGSADAVLATKGNFNNDIGMPLTLLMLKKQHQFAVIEMGMNHLGEIDYLTRLASPSIALINNAGTAHIGELGSKDAIAQAKGEIFAGLNADGVAIINADDAYADYWKSLNVGRKIITFGLNKGADISLDASVTASAQETNGITQIKLSTPSGAISFNLNILGEHNVRNALAASAIAFALNISLQNIATGLANFTGVAGRLTRRAGFNGALVIDDTYNANPDSIRVAIDVLVANPSNSIMVMGDMGELGEGASKLHAEIGTYAQKAGVQTFYTLGDMSLAAHQAFNDATPNKNAQHFASIECLIIALKTVMNSDTVVLVKASRFMQMERVVNMILDEQTAQEASTQENSTQASSAKETPTKEQQATQGAHSCY